VLPALVQFRCSMTTTPPVPTQAPRLALALSGGGFRAALFHLGVLRRLAEARWLERLDVLSCVSGGSILGAFLASRWDSLADRPDQVQALDQEIVQPFVRIVSTTSFIHRWAVRVPLHSVRRLVGRAYSRTSLAADLYGDIFALPEIGALPMRPRLIINASNLLSARSWRFTREGAGDSRFGYAVWDAPFALGAAVAASAAFPPAFPPYRFPTRGIRFSGPVYGESALSLPAFMPLSDGGVYDNLGVEVLSKRTALPGHEITPATFTVVSDGGYPPQQRFRTNGLPVLGEGLLLYRVDEMARDQVGALRRRMLVRQFEDPRDPLAGTLIVLGSSIERLPHGARAAYVAAVGEEALIPAPLLRQLQCTRTHLNVFSEIECQALMYHGYTLTDAVLWAYCNRHPEAFRTTHPGAWRIRFTSEVTAAWSRGIAATMPR
jgi:NTE family protein